MISITEWQKIGVGTTGFGIFFILFGMLLYFDSVLLAFGNLLFLTGLSLIIGLRKTFSFFFQRHKLKGTSFFLGGVLVVLLRWPLLGMCLETYGFFSLFKGFFPVAFGFLGNTSNIPFLSAVSGLCSWLGGDALRWGEHMESVHCPQKSTVDPIPSPLKPPSPGWWSQLLFPSLYHLQVSRGDEMRGPMSSCA
uniref:Golgi transport 1A n=1 Tax=Sus scrofa TaxID=9823 RepID=A0A4X1V1G6_PIG